MPNKVSVETILSPFFKANRNSLNPELTVSFETFKDRIIENDIYTSASSIKTAWKRLRGSEYYLRGNDEVCVLDLAGMRRLFLGAVAEKERNRNKQTSEAY